MEKEDNKKIKQSKQKEKKEEKMNQSKQKENNKKIKQKEKISKKTKNTNAIKVIKILTIILLIVLISMIGFFGIYKQNKNQISNVVKDYSYSMAIDGARTIKLTVNDENSEEAKTEENYNKSKKIIEKRLESLGVEEYNISLNTTTGEIIIEIPENSDTDTVVSNLSTVGKFEIIDSQTEEVLLDNSNIKSSSVLYSSTTSGTAVYLEIAFNKDGKDKLEEISKTYVPAEETDETEDSTEESTKEETADSEDATTENTAETVGENEITEETTNEDTTAEDETEESTEKQITMKINDEEIMTTSFDEPITTGKIQLSVGSASTDETTLKNYITQAQSIATSLDNGNLPVKYDIEKNQYVLSDISEQEIGYIAIVVAVVAVIGIIVLIIKYKTNGLLAGISYIGLAALYLLLVRYTNVVVSIESILGIVIILILNFIFTFMLLNKIENNVKENKENAVNKATSETYKEFFIKIIPICILSIAFCFMKWIPINSFGMISFWGLVMIAAYNVVVTRYLLNINEAKGM